MPACALRSVCPPCGLLDPPETGSMTGGLANGMPLVLTPRPKAFRLPASRIRRSRPDRAITLTPLHRGFVQCEKIGAGARPRVQPVAGILDRAVGERAELIGFH